MIRTMVESLVSEKGGRKGLRQDLHQRDIPGFESFLRRSFFYKHLLDFGCGLHYDDVWFASMHSVVCQACCVTVVICHSCGSENST